MWVIVELLGCKVVLIDNLGEVFIEDVVIEEMVFGEWEVIDLFL